MKRLMMTPALIGLTAAAMPLAVIGSVRADASGNVEALLRDVKSELERVGNDLKPMAEKAFKAAEASNVLSQATKDQIDKELKAFHELSAAQSKLEGKLEALETRNLDLEQQVAAGTTGGRRGVQSLGQQLAQSDDLKAYAANPQGNLTMRPSAAITSVDGSAGGLIWETQERTPVELARQTMRIRQLLNVVRTNSPLIVYAKQVVRVNNAAPTAEGAPLPASNYGWTKAEAAVRKIGHYTNVSDEALADADQLQGMIDGELRYGLELEEEEQVLAGDGVGENLDGLIPNATAFVAAAGLPNTTRIDRLRLGLLQVALSNYAATGVTLHPTDWAGIDLTKDTQGRYIFGNPNTVSSPMLWGLNVIPTLAHSVGEWMVGNFFMAATLYDRQDIEVLISSEHGTNFIDGMKTIKATERVALANKRPGALVTGDFTFV